MVSSRDQHHPPLYETVLVLTDGTDRARRLADWTLVFIETPLMTVHHVDVLDCLDSGVIIQTHDDSGQNDSDRSERTPSQSLSHHVTSQNHGHDPTLGVLHGVPSEALLEYLDANAIDLLIMSVRDSAYLDRTLLGNAFTRVSQTATVPTVTITDTNNPHNLRCEMGYVAEGEVLSGRNT